MIVNATCSHTQIAANIFYTKHVKMKKPNKACTHPENTEPNLGNRLQFEKKIGGTISEKKDQNYSCHSSLNMFNEIGILVKVNSVNVNNRHFATETCNEELLPIYDAVSRRDNIDLLRMNWGYQILGMFEKGESGANASYLHDLFQLVIHYVCTWEYRECIANNDGKDFGIIVHFDEFEKIASIDLVDYEQWLVMLDSETSKADSRQY